MLRCLVRPGSNRHTRSSSTQSLNTILSKSLVVSLAQDEKRTPSEAMTELQMLHPQNTVLMSELAATHAQLDAANAHCTVAQRETTDVRVQLDQQR